MVARAETSAHPDRHSREPNVTLEDQEYERNVEHGDERGEHRRTVRDMWQAVESGEPEQDEYQSAPRPYFASGPSVRQEHPERHVSDPRRDERRSHALSSLVPCPRQPPT